MNIPETTLDKSGQMDWAINVVNPPPSKLQWPESLACFHHGEVHAPGSVGHRKPCLDPEGRKSV